MRKNEKHPGRKSGILCGKRVVYVVAVFETYVNFFRRYPLLLAVGLISLLGTLGFAVIFPTLPLYLSEDLGISAGIIGLIFGAYAASETIFKTPLGFLSDRLGRRPLIIAGLAISFLVPLASRPSGPRSPP